MSTVKRPRGEDVDEDPPAKIARLDNVTDEMLLAALAEYECTHKTSDNDIPPSHKRAREDDTDEPPAKRAREDDYEAVEPPAERARVDTPTLQRLNEPVDGELLGPVSQRLAFALSVAQRTYHWYKQRYMRFVSGSNASDAMGLCVYGIREKRAYLDSIGFAADVRNQRQRLLMAEACGLIPGDKLMVGDLDVCHMYRGTLLEHLVRVIIARIFGVRVFDLPSLPMPGVDWIWVSPDGLLTIVINGVVVKEIAAEIKCPRILKDEKPPIGYYVQMQLEMLVLGVNECIYVRLDWQRFRDEVWVRRPHPPEADYPADGIDKSATGALGATMQRRLAEDRAAVAWAEGELMAMDLEVVRSYVVVETVTREEGWLERNLPTLRAFYDRVLAERARLGMTEEKWLALNQISSEQNGKEGRDDNQGGGGDQEGQAQGGGQAKGKGGQAVGGDHGDPGHGGG